MEYHPREWYTRGNLPHRDNPNLLQFLTWHLADSVPRKILDQLEQELATKPMTDSQRDAERRRKIEALLDRGYGNCWLRRHKAAGLLRDIFLSGNGNRYDMHGFVIMPNHVHLLVQFFPCSPMGETIAEWKGLSAAQINSALQREGELWDANYWDRYIRDEEHYRNTIRYILLNPVKAGLLKNWRQWPNTYRDEQMSFSKRRRFEDPRLQLG